MANDIITLTLAAEEYIAEILQKNPGNAFKIAVDGKGCAGLQYSYELLDESKIDSKDELITRDWGKVVVDHFSVLYLVGSTLNLREDLFSCELVWTNPQATSTCGCGKSFNPGY